MAAGHRRIQHYGIVAFGLLAILATACSKESEKSPASAQNPDWKRGRAVFLANCVACHNNDPSKDGPIGPAIKGSPQELIEARVLKSTYPPGYKPKRTTKVMPQFPFLKSEIPYLAAYLKN
ncbi:MAG TPA: cytochrome c [Candidatus Binatia bacterium]|jgi:predicted CxxxxCH...CXXCH cytochrome family protein